MIFCLPYQKWEQSSLLSIIILNIVPIFDREEKEIIPYVQHY